MTSVTVSPMREIVDVVGEAALGDELLGLAAAARRLSTSATLRPGTRKHTWAHVVADLLDVDGDASGSKMSKSGQNRTRVPVRLGGIFLTISSSCDAA